MSFRCETVIFSFQTFAALIPGRMERTLLWSMLGNTISFSISKFRQTVN